MDHLPLPALEVAVTAAGICGAGETPREGDR